MEKIQVNIARSFLKNIVFSLLLTFITLIILFQVSDSYVENNPLNQFGAIYNIGSIGVCYQLSNVRELIANYPYPSYFETFLINLKIIVSGRFDTNIALMIFGICLLLIYAVKYIKVKIVE